MRCRAISRAGRAFSETSRLYAFAGIALVGLAHIDELLIIVVLAEQEINSALPSKSVNVLAFRQLDVRDSVCHACPVVEFTFNAAVWAPSMRKRVAVLTVKRLSFTVYLLGRCRHTKENATKYLACQEQMHFGFAQPRFGP